MFTSLRARLTVLYAALFGLALLITAIAVYVSVGANARTQVERELASAGAVFDRVWAMRARQLTDGATVLSRDFGFREAVATGDAPTVESALDNLRDRLALDRAMLVGMDGTVTGGKDLDEAAASDLWYALDGGATSGVLTIDGAPYQAVAAPILAPQLTGWVVFAVRLDQGELAALEKLSSIPLTADVLTHADKGWISAAGKPAEGAVSRFIDAALKAKSGDPRRLDAAGGAAVALARPLGALGKENSVLVLRYPLALAMAPYNALLVSLVLVGGGGLAVLIAGSWLLAGSITRPVQALDEAAHRLERGEDAVVEIATRDEIGRLAGSFNAMAAGIRDREGRITHMALTDQDTGLPNRRALEQAVEASAPEGLWIAVLGLERYGQVRAAVGYRLAADMIREVGRRAGELMPGCACARLSGERLVLMVRAAGPAAAERALADLVEALNAPVRVEGVTIDVVLTGGLAPVADVHGIPAIERASIALDQARDARLAVALFDAGAYGDPASKLSMMSEMVEALESGAISLHYQPKHDVRAGRITGAEALLRWNHPERGFIRPDLFVELAEETGHIRALTRWTLERALADQAAMRAAGLDLLVSVNLSGRLVADAAFAEETIALIGKSGGRLCLEITETAVIGNPTAALEVIDRFREAGVGVSIDDYGSGLSSLAYLKQIHADELKIDKTFVLGLSENARDALLVKSTIDLAHSLGLKIVAEGVESAEALALLAGMGCDLAQGYFIARPMPMSGFMDFMASSTAETPKAPRKRA